MNKLKTHQEAIEHIHTDNIQIENPPQQQLPNINDLLNNPDIVRKIGYKNIQRIVRLRGKIENIIEEPDKVELYIGEFTLESKNWIGILFRRK